MGHLVIKNTQDFQDSTFQGQEEEAELLGKLSPIVSGKLSLLQPSAQCCSQGGDKEYNPPPPLRTLVCPHQSFFLKKQASNLFSDHFH